MDTAFFSVSFRRSLRQLSSLRSFHCSAPQTFPVPHPRLRLLLPYRSRHFSGTRCKSCKANHRKHRRTRPSHRRIGKRIVKRVSRKSLRLGAPRAEILHIHDMRPRYALLSCLYFFFVLSRLILAETADSLAHAFCAVKRPVCLFNQRRRRSFARRTEHRARLAACVGSVREGKFSDFPADLRALFLNDINVIDISQDHDKLIAAVPAEDIDVPGLFP